MTIVVVRITVILRIITSRVGAETSREVVIIHISLLLLLLLLGALRLPAPLAARQRRDIVDRYFCHRDNMVLITNGHACYRRGHSGRLANTLAYLSTRSLVYHRSRDALDCATRTSAASGDITLQLS